VLLNLLQEYVLTRTGLRSCRKKWHSSDRLRSSSVHESGSSSSSGAVSFHDCISDSGTLVIMAPAPDPAPASICTRQ